MLWWTYQQLRMGNPKYRLAVLEKLIASNDDEAIGPLIFALKDKDATVRCAAAKALMRCQDRRAVEPLVKMLRDTVPLARAAAAETLGHLGDPVAVNHLVGFLRDADPIVRTIAARSLNRLGWKPRTDSHRVLQILAMGNLHQLVALGPEGVSPLLELLRNGPPNKQFSAVKALGEISDPRVRPAMLEALRKTSAAVRIAALGTLERLADPSTFSEVEKLLRDTNASVRAAAVEAAIRCGGARAVPALLDVESSVRSAATATLQKLDRHWAQNEAVRQVVPKIIRAVKHHDYWVRYSASKLLELLQIDPNNLPAELPAAAPEKPAEEIPPHPAVGVLADMLFDRDREFRLVAAEALGRLREKSAGSVLTAALRDVDFSVRQAVQTALAALN